LAVLGIALGAGAGYLVATRIVFPLPDVLAASFLEVPDLSGLTVQDAETRLRDVGLLVGPVDSIRHPRVEPGVVVGQTPLPGQLATPGGAIGLSVSEGSERRMVPDVTRMRGDRAITVLATAGFQVSVDSIETDFPAGRVYATVPEGGVERSLPTRVYVTVSLGPPPFPMPNLVGMEEDRARDVIESLGLEVGEIDQDFGFFSFGGPEVIRHTPPADAMVAPGTAVDLVIRRNF
jgi:serine/threonine-protein kinase